MKISITMLLLLSGLHLFAQLPLSFIACGDMPYNNPADLNRFRNLIKEVNALNPSFTVHVGDIKSGATPCTDEYMLTIKELFMQFEGPLIYTPGDNEWTDCDRQAAGSYSPLERLEKLRKVFYDGKKSLGQKPLNTTNQHIIPKSGKFVENQYWQMQQTSFGTLHIVGTNNNMVVDSTRLAEFMERDQANLKWLDYIFDEAEKNNQSSIVLFTHAAMDYKATLTSGFFNMIRQLRQRVEKFNRPVLLVYGDAHRLMLEKPLASLSGKLLNNFTTLQVPGDLEMHAVRVDIDPVRKSVFSISEVWVDGN